MYHTENENYQQHSFILKNDYIKMSVTYAIGALHVDVQNYIWLRHYFLIL